MLLTVKQVSERTGFSTLKVRSLIHSGRLLAVDTSPGAKACWRIREEDLTNFLTPDSVKERPAKRSKVESRKRIDADVPKVFS